MSTMTGSRRGIERERTVRRKLEGEDWIVFRAAGSIGCADLVALRAGSIPMLVEVKSTAGGPYERFGPKQRQDLAAMARLAGAQAWLCWWPANAKQRWIRADEWPER